MYVYIAEKFHSCGSRIKFFTEPKIIWEQKVLNVYYIRYVIQVLPVVVNVEINIVLVFILNFYKLNNCSCYLLNNYLTYWDAFRLNLPFLLRV